MQPIAPLTLSDLLANPTQPLLKFEVYVDGAWVDIDEELGGDYLQSISLSLAGGLKPSPEPIAATWRATIFNKDSLFLPRHPSSGYKNYFIMGRKVRLSIGINVSGSKYYWVQITGTMSKPNFEGMLYDVNLSGFDSCQALVDTKMQSPNNYWGSSIVKSTQAGWYRYVLPSTAQGVYIAYWNGSGVYNQNDWTYHDGITWMAQGRPYPGCLGVLSLVSLDNGVVFAGGWGVGEARVLKSTDYGISWTASNVLGEQSAIRSLAWLGGNTVIAGSFSGGKIFRSVDRGGNWTDLGQQGGAHTIDCLADVGGGIALAGIYPNGKILRSTDYGATWDDLGQQYGQTEIFSVVSLGGGVALAGTQPDGKILRSTDSGATWSDLGTLVAGEATVVALISLGGGIVLASTTSNGHIVRSVDSGLNWTDLGQQYGQNVIYGFADLGGGIVLAGTSLGGKILRSTDYGLTWEDLGQQFNHETVWALTSPASGVVVAAVAYETIRSSNAGDSQKEFVFNSDKTIEDGVDNLDIYYFETQIPEEVIADILVSAGLYADRAAALAAMEYTATGKTIKRVWFESGNSAQDSVKKLCELLNYRFRFKYNNIPIFKPKPEFKVAGSEDFSLLEYQITDVKFYEDDSELANRIVIEGEEQAPPLWQQGTERNRLKGSIHDQNSIDLNGEKNLNIKNHLFQDQATINGMLAELLAERKNKRQYVKFVLAFSPIPVEEGDTVKFQVRFTPQKADEGNFYGTCYYGDCYYEGDGLVVSLRGLVRDIKVDNYETTLYLELEQEE